MSAATTAAHSGGRSTMISDKARQESITMDMLEVENINIISTFVFVEWKNILLGNVSCLLLNYTTLCYLMRHFGKNSIAAVIS